MKQKNKEYDKLHKLSLQAKILHGISGLLHWDQETHMPPGASSIRGMQLETLAGLIHEAKTNDEFAKALFSLIDRETGAVKANHLSEEQHAALREWRRDYLKEIALPKKFVEEFAKLTSESILAWRDAKKNNSFSTFSPYLDKIVTMVRKKSDLLGWTDDPYDPLIDEFEPDATTKEVSALFLHLRKSILPLLKKIQADDPVDDSFLFGKFPHLQQLRFGKKILNDMGYDMNRGRLDLSTHPFSSSSHPTDSRITTRIHPTSLMSNISVILHEGGHSLYEMGLPASHYGSPLGEAISLGIHESQSRWWECRIGLSQPFWQYYLPLLKNAFKGKLDKVTLPQFYRAINKVEPSLIRVEADEVTYSLHVILRFELERELVHGKLKVRDLPDAWNNKMKELLGIIPKTDTEGCLQDIHWSMGAFGYFPTYTLGNLYCAHFFEAFEKEIPDWQKKVSHGELLFIKDWLHQNIFQHGRRYRSNELLTKVTGKPFTANAYVKYLKSKF